ncbi:MAG: glucuronate isomerase [Bacillota bacterium]|nr:glucuronate isomerase [Bacillota bacterium]
MKKFMDESFLLTNPISERLYHEYAKKMPILDYHCHLDPQEIAENKRYSNITELWLAHDHYKWRAMRANGIEEKYITGDATDKEKFLKWAETLPRCIGNPLYHWSHLELKRYFNIDSLLSPETAEEIWDKCNDLLQQDGFSARGFIERSNVKGLCTTDDPIDSLEYHRALKDDGFATKVYPTFRPDRAFDLSKPGFVRWINKLMDITGIEIETFQDYQEALKYRIDFFHSMGCRLSDHGIDRMVYGRGTIGEATEILGKALGEEELTKEEMSKFNTQVQLFLGREYASRGWTMQLHLAAMRDNSRRMYDLIGPNTGFDAMDDQPYGEYLANFLSDLDQTDELPKTILYSLNPMDNELLITIAGCFQSGPTPGKMQLGSGWWFNDQKDGMIRQMVALANMGLISRFVGMLTDSRSFLSYTRHEYFRRILCDLFGTWVYQGEAPNDLDLLGSTIEDICYNNARDYFKLEL